MKTVWPAPSASHTRAHAAGALVCVDNSFLTPLYQRPLDLKQGRVDMSQGGGGRASAQLVETIFTSMGTQSEVGAIHDKAVAANVTAEIIFRDTRLTDSEKYHAMRAVNPLVDEMRKRFDLGLENE